MATRVGVDVGGTNTDAVVVRGLSEVIGWAKVVTTEDVTTGLGESVKEALRAAKIGPDEVQGVMLGSTHFVNACIQQRGLAKVAVIRLCGPATHALPPFCDMPPRLRDAVAGYFMYISGGYEYDGKAGIGAVNRDEIAAAVAEIAGHGITSVVISGVFSPVNDQQEEAVGRMVEQELSSIAGVAGPVDVCLSHRVGQLGLLERESAAILNAALLPLARRVLDQCEQAVMGTGIRAPLFITANDGTLMPVADALRLPVATFQSGPVNSLRGAAVLCGVRDGVVLDIGGTTTDVGVIVNGLPRPAPRAVKFAGVTTNFQMPDVFSIGLGGGSILHWHGSAANLAAPQAHCRLPSPARPSKVAAASGDDTEEPGPDGVGGLTCYEACSVGPDSVGNALLERALCMGGATPTATDVAVLLGRMELGDEACVKQQLPQESARKAWLVMQSMLEWCVDQCKTHKGDVPVIVVGGGAPLCGETLRGAARVVSPPFAAVANAIGAAIPQVSGLVDAVFQLGPTAESRQRVLQHAEQLAMCKAVQAGALLDACQVAVREEVPLAYLPGNTARIRVKVIGDLDLQQRQAPSEGPSVPGPGSASSSGEQASPSSNHGSAAQADAAAGEGALPPSEANEAARGGAEPAAFPAMSFPGRGEDIGAGELAAWEPQVNEQGEWVIHEPDLHLIAIGTGILGTGGGGSPAKAKLKALMELQRCGPGSIRVVHPSSIPAEGLVVDAGYMGAPTVGIEKLDSDQAEAAIRAVLQAYNASERPGQLMALMAGEVGGGNGIEPLVIGSRMRLPVVDGDLMGRAFPELQMMTSAMYGLPITPAALVDEKGNAVVVQNVRSAEWLEKMLRPVCTEMGCSAGFSCRPLTGEQLQQVLIPHTLSLAWRLGHAVALAQHKKLDPGCEIAAEVGGHMLFRGKVVDVERKTTEGFARGCLTLDDGGSGCTSAIGEPKVLKLFFQNENLVAYLDGDCVASVPDLICCVEAENGMPISTEEMRYGLRVAVIGIPAHPLLTTPQGLAVVGPAAFGYCDVQFKPLGQHKPVQPIPRAPSPAVK